jgi:ATP-dependent DNA helicase RecG
VLIYLLDNDQISRKDAVALLGYGETKIKEVLNTLLEKQLIIRVGQGRGTYYKIIIMVKK